MGVQVKFLTECFTSALALLNATLWSQSVECGVCEDSSLVQGRKLKCEATGGRGEGLLTPAYLIYLCLGIQLSL